MNQKTGQEAPGAPRMDAIRTEVDALRAVGRHPMNLEHVPDALETEAMFLNAVRQSGHALRDVPDGLMTRKVCWAAAGAGRGHVHGGRAPERGRTGPRAD